MVRGDPQFGTAGGVGSQGREGREEKGVAGDREAIQAGVLPGQGIEGVADTLLWRGSQR